MTGQGQHLLLLLLLVTWMGPWQDLLLKTSMKLVLLGPDLLLLLLLHLWVCFLLPLLLLLLLMLLLQRCSH